MWYVTVFSLTMVLKISLFSTLLGVLEIGSAPENVQNIIFPTLKMDA